MEGQATPIKHSFWDNMRFMFGNMWQWDPVRTILSFLRAPFIVVIPLLGIYLSRTVLLLAESGAQPGRIATEVAVICATMAVCAVALNWLNGQNRRTEFKSSREYQIIIMGYTMSHDYEYNESPAGSSAARKAFENTGDNDSGTRRFIDTASSFVSNCIGIISYAALIILLNPFIFLTICTTTVVSLLLMRRITSWSRRNKDNWIPIRRKQEYLRKTAMDTVPAKDIRLYNMAGWLRSVFDTVVRQRMDWRQKEERYSYGINMLCALLSFIREGLAYGLLIYTVYAAHMAVADFILYFGIIGGFTVWFDGLADNFFMFNKINTGFCEMREFFDYQNKGNQGEGAAVPGETFAVEFKHVDYRFAGGGATGDEPNTGGPSGGEFTGGESTGGDSAGSEPSGGEPSGGDSAGSEPSGSGSAACAKEMFHDFNLTIRKGEKLAIVGLNGAGKTTLVKLLCGLYNPTSGVILAGGRPIGDYNIDEYHSLFSAVFQDITILPMTVRQNIACQLDDIDESRLSDAMQVSGFCDVVGQMENGADTYLVQGLYPGGIDLSGGETQKLALARALYRDGKFLILDEPTAALDPIAESAVYEQYNNIAAGKTSVFISHRLASTRFCDRIIFIEDGRIAEEGTHDDLMAKRGKYYDLFEVQSHYYREDAVL